MSKFALQHPLLANKEELERFYGRAGRFARNALDVGESRAFLLAVLQINGKCKWIMSTWTLRFHDPN